ncbi:biotin--[acetyl-CoA-carboxylase] ligase [Bifidobacterium tsurumiense]|uniref:biotin--[acetyl-CoA-carboxylase] ligase n=1 Tax=Bifidobacterium tsurumiense TaxID=356829 RepID=UPI0004206C0E|nr:hypothetical protein [Bifidobacterium tsurumiense]
MSETIVAEDAEMPLSEQVADSVVRYVRVGSTNDVARQALLQGKIGYCDSALPPMALIAADVQESGRGRMGREWLNRPGECFMVSFVSVVPSSVVYGASINGWLPVLAGLCSIDAVNEVLGHCNAHAIHDDCRLMLKWPNDIFCEGFKMGGILVESVQLGRNGAGKGIDNVTIHADASPDNTRENSSHDDGGQSESLVGVIFGIGLNMNIPAESLPTQQATSLQLHWEGLPQATVLRDRIAAGIAAKLREGLRSLMDNPTEYVDQLLKRYVRMCWTVGRRVKANLVDGTVRYGKALSIMSDASLRMMGDDGQIHVVHTGDVGILPAQSDS